MSQNALSSVDLKFFINTFLKSHIIKSQIHAKEHEKGLTDCSNLSLHLHIPSLTTIVRTAKNASVWLVIAVRLG